MICCVNGDKVSTYYFYGVLVQKTFIKKYLSNRNRTSDRWISWHAPLQSTALPTELSREKTHVVPSMRIELTTLGLLDPRSNQLSYEGLVLLSYRFYSVLKRSPTQFVNCTIIRFSNVYWVASISTRFFSLPWSTQSGFLCVPWIQSTSSSFIQYMTMSLSFHRCQFPLTSRSIVAVVLSHQEVL